jgi:hypothetical protein
LSIAAEEYPQITQITQIRNIAAADFRFLIAAWLFPLSIGNWQSAIGNVLMAAS